MAVTIIYDTFTFPFVKGPYSFTQTPGRVTISFQTLLQEASSGALISKESSMLAACVGVKKSVSIAFNSSAEFTYTNTTNGFNSKCTISKVEDPSLSLETCRIYRVSIEIETPYNQDSGRIAGNFVINYDTVGRVSVYFNATYLAITGQLDAYLNAKTNAIIWAESVITTYFPGLDFERLNAKFDLDHNGKTCYFSANYQEVIYNLETLDSQDLFQDTNISYTTNYTPFLGCTFFAEDRKYSPGVLNLSISFTGRPLFRGKAGNVNPTGVENSMTAVCDSYINEIKGYLLKEIDKIDYSFITQGTPGKKIIKHYSHRFNPSDYVLNSNMELQILMTSYDIFSITDNVTINNDNGLVPQKLWNGNDYSFVIYHTGKRRTARRSYTIGRFSPATEGLPPIPDSFPGGGNGHWLLLNVDDSGYVENHGGSTINGLLQLIHWKTYVEVYMWVANADPVDVYIRSSADGVVSRNTSTVSNPQLVVITDPGPVAPPDTPTSPGGGVLVV